jgi:hypothetical protein
LANHSEILIEQLDEGTNGKKSSTLFLQELGREANNDWFFKSYDATIQKIVDERLPRKIRTDDEYCLINCLFIDVVT